MWQKYNATVSVINTSILSQKNAAAVTRSTGKRTWHERHTVMIRNEIRGLIYRDGCQDIFILKVTAQVFQRWMKLALDQYLFAMVSINFSKGRKPLSAPTCCAH